MGFLVILAYWPVKGEIIKVVEYATIFTKAPHIFSEQIFWVIRDIIFVLVPSIFLEIFPEELSYFFPLLIVGIFFRKPFEKIYR